VEVVYRPKVAPDHRLLRHSSARPNPKRGKTVQSFFFSARTQQMLVDTYAHRSFHGQVKEKGAHVPCVGRKF